MKKTFRLIVAVSALFLTCSTAHAQSEYATCYPDPFDNRYHCEARSIFHIQIESFAWYVTIPSGYMDYTAQIWLYGSGYGYVWLTGGSGSFFADTYNTNWVSEQGSFNVGTSSTWVDSEVYISNGELTMTAGW